VARRHDESERDQAPGAAGRLRCHGLPVGDEARVSGLALRKAFRHGSSSKPGVTWNATGVAEDIDGVAGTTPKCND
jgi:hypothetical protein